MIGGDMREHFWHVRSGVVAKTSMGLLPAALPDRLFLVAASGLAEFGQAVKGQKQPWTFLASSMSDGNLHLMRIRA